MVAILAAGCQLSSRIFYGFFYSVWAFFRSKYLQRRTTFWRLLPWKWLHFQIVFASMEKVALPNTAFKEKVALPNSICIHGKGCTSKYYLEVQPFPWKQILFGSATFSMEANTIWKCKFFHGSKYCFEVQPFPWKQILFGSATFSMEANTIWKCNLFHGSKYYLEV